MQLEHRFTVPVPADVAWAALLDPERVTPCFPGATLQSVDGSEFTGTVKVRLGPIALLYKGKGVFTNTDEQARRTVIEASGRDSRGNGMASANVAVHVSPEGEATSVELVTDLTITGRPAQLGRGLIAEVGGKIVATFADCLAERLTGSPADQPKAGSPEAGGAVAGGSAAGGSVAGGAVAGGAVAGGSAAGEPDAGESVAGEPAAGYEPAAGEPAAGELAAGESAAGATLNAGRSAAEQPGTAGQQEGLPEINLIEVAGAPVLKRLLPVLLGVLIVLAVVRRVLARR